MIDSPCHGCPRRFVGCHSVCPDYAKFRAKVDAVNEKKWTALAAETVLIAHAVEMNDKIKKRKR